MNLATRWLGLDLAHPLVPSASQPLSRDVGMLRRLEDAGASAVVLHSLFEEQITHESAEVDHVLDHGTESFAESLSYLPPQPRYVHGPHEYLELVRQAKEALDIPVVGSLNGATNGGWTKYAGLIEEAGADALELNVYVIPVDVETTGRDVEDRYIEILEAVKAQVSIPVAMKIGPFISAIPHFARRLEDSGADGLALFNRYFQSDIDLEALEMDPRLVLSTSYEILLPLRWLAILRGHVKASLAATSGVYGPADALKLIMAGADVVHLCGALLKHGPGRLGEIRDGMVEWLEEHGYESLDQARGSMSRDACPDPGAFERANYMKALHSYA